MQFPASESGFSRTRITTLSAPQNRQADHSVSSISRSRESTPGPPAELPYNPETELWHRGASSSGFRLSNRDLQPRLEPAGAARGSGERAPQLKASTLALPGALYLPGGEGTG